MPSYNRPKKNSAFVIYISLPSVGTANVFQANPTIAAGDFKVSTNGGALGNLATLPVVTPASGKLVKISLSASEMNGDNVTVVCSDAAGAEWGDVTFDIKTAVADADDIPDAVAQKIAAHTWRISVANIESDSTADTITNGVPSAYSMICEGNLLFETSGSDLIYKKNDGTTILKRAITVNASTQITGIAKGVSG